MSYKIRTADYERGKDLRDGYSRSGIIGMNERKDRMIDRGHAYVNGQNSRIIRPKNRTQNEGKRTKHTTNEAVASQSSGKGVGNETHKLIVHVEADNARRACHFLVAQWIVEFGGTSASLKSSQLLSDVLHILHIPLATPLSFLPPAKVRCQTTFCARAFLRCPSLDPG